MTAWNVYHDTKLKEMYLDGSTFTEICQELNKQFGTQRSRNSVSGRIDRLKLPMRPRPVKTEIKAEPRVRKFWGDRQFVAASYVPINQGEGITILELKNDSCRYPTDDSKRLFCGVTTTANGESYCQYHRTICYKAHREGQ